MAPLLSVPNDEGGFLAPRVHESAFIAPTAAVTGDVEVAKDASIFYGASVRGDVDSIRIGERTNVQDNATLHADAGHPCILGDDISVGHNAVVHGCTVENGTLIGMHATVLSGAVVGAGSLVAAGALVTEGTVIPPGSLVAGVPGKVRREVTDAEIERMREGVEHYVALGRLQAQAREA